LCFRENTANLYLFILERRLDVKVLRAFVNLRGCVRRPAVLQRSRVGQHRHHDLFDDVSVGVLGLAAELG
jgi:hypothetical protein